MMVPRTTSRAAVDVRGLYDVNSAGRGINDRIKMKSATGSKNATARMLKGLGVSEESDESSRAGIRQQQT